MSKISKITSIVSAALGTVLLLAACAPVQTSSQANLASGEQRVVSVGDVVLHVDRRRSLQNAFGNADVFGGTTDAGFAEIRYLGQNEDGHLVFGRRDVRVTSSETTMSRYGPMAAAANSNSETTVMVQGSPQQDMTGNDATRITLDLSTGNILTLDGVGVEILDATPSMIRVRRIQ